MIQRIFIPMVVKVYIATGIVLYTIQKTKMAIRRMKDGDRSAAKLKSIY